jgi:hypothetical protein
MGFGGTGGGDIHPWHGWIMGYNAATFTQTAIMCLTPNSYGSSIWQAGGGLASDGTYIYVVTGNDDSSQYTESFLKLDQSLNVVDYFTPSNFGNLDANDLDMTSGKLMLIPGTTFLTGGGKDYRVWLVNTASMGHVQGTGTAPQVFYTNSNGPEGDGIYGGMFMNDVGYFPNGDGSIYAFSFSNLAYNTTATKTTASYPFPGADMSGSANGTVNGIVWAITAQNSADSNPQAGTLRAFNASTLVELWNSGQHPADQLGGFAKFVIPIVANGKVYAASTSTIQVYGLSSTPGTVAITVNSVPPGLAFQVDGTTYTAAQVFQWTPGANHTIAVTSSPQAGGTGIQNVYSSWSDGGAQSHTITVPSSSSTYTANFTTQYLLTTSAGTGGTISPASEWVNGGTVVSISASATTGYQFTGFTGGVTGTTTPANLTMNAPASVTASFTTSGGGGGGPNWYNSAWGYQKAITITHGQVSGSSSLSNFPVLISLPADADLVAHAQSNGNDILFTDASGTNKLNHEIETFNSTTGQLIAWVQVPSVSPAADTVLYLYFGNASASNQQSTAGTWDSSYQGVWHLPNGTTLSAGDSTAHANNGVISNASAVAGKIGGGAGFNGSNASVDLGSGTGLHITGPITAEAWINVAAWPANGYPAGLLGMGYNYASNQTGWMLEASTDNSGKHYLNWFSNNGSTHGVVTAVPSLATGAWHHLAGTFDGSTWKMYVDGAVNGTSADATAPLNNGDDIVAGGLSTNGYGTIFRFNGLLDELRVSNTARSANWIATEYNNQNSPSTFYAIGSEQNSTLSSLAVAISPSVGTLTANQPLQFSVSVTGTTNQQVTWSLSGPGALLASGLYTAPGSVTTQTTATVTATSAADPTKSTSVNITLNPAIAVVINPSIATLTANQPLQFSASVTGTTNQQVNWSLSGPGTLLASGLYTAPGSVTTQTTATVTATSAADPTKSASVSVTLTPTASTASCGAPQTNAWTGCYYQDASFSNLAFTRIDPYAQFNWASATPGPGVGPGPFSVRWQGSFTGFQSSWYLFTISTSGQVKLYIDNQLVLDSSTSTSQSPFVTWHAMTSGTHLIELDYVHTSGPASVILSFATP